MDEKTFRLPSAAEIIMRLTQVSDEQKLQNDFYPLISKHAGREMTASGIHMMFLFAIEDYSPNSAPGNMNAILSAFIPSWIESLVDDKEIATLAKKEIKEVRAEISAEVGRKGRSKKFPQAETVKRKVLRLTREQYHSRLLQMPIHDPALDDLLAVCPHLTSDQVAGLYRRVEKGKDNKAIYFAVPATKIKNAWITLSLDKESLRIAFASRTPSSYADQSKKHGDVFHDVEYMNEAMAYAKKFWGNDLTKDSWESVGRVILDDPTNLNYRGFPTTVVEIFWAINRDWNRLINDHSKPESQLWDDAIVHVTIDPIEAMELRGGRGGHAEFNCAYCGAGLSLNGCDNCHHTFKDNSWRSGWYTPLPPKIVNLLQKSGHIFKLNPEVAQQKEKDLFGKGAKKRQPRRNVFQWLQNKLLQLHI